MTALEMYDKLCIAGPLDDVDDTAAVTSAMASATIASPSKGKTRDPDTPPLHLHPDLEDLNFGSISNSPNLPAPIRPSTLSDDEETSPTHRPSLSDFSDYESSGDETRPSKVASSSKKNFVTVSDNEEGLYAGKGSAHNRSLIDDNDPFADPFADSRAPHSR